LLVNVSASSYFESNLQILAITGKSTIKSLVPGQVSSHGGTSSNFVSLQSSTVHAFAHSRSPNLRVWNPHIQGPGDWGWEVRSVWRCAPLFLSRRGRGSGSGGCLSRRLGLQGNRKMPLLAGGRLRWSPFGLFSVDGDDKEERVGDGGG